MYQIGNHMESKNNSSRGIQQDDVWAAADSLIADGLRPTIERVRQKIGRGSPNTVSPMLEAWFATLASRLGVNKPDDLFGNIPKSFTRAIQNAWEIALSEGREKSALEIAHAQADLRLATQALNEREIRLVQIEQLRAVQHQALGDALEAAKNNTKDAQTRLSEIQNLVGSREMEIQNLHVKLVAAETERDSERFRHQEAVADHIQRKQKIEERADATNRKLQEEIDRARQETKKISGEAYTMGKKLAAEKIFLEERIRSQEKDLVRIQVLHVAQSSDLEALRQATTMSVSRSHALENLFKTQLADSSLTITRLTEALSIRRDRPAAISKFMVRKLKRPGVIRKG